MFDLPDLENKQLMFDSGVTWHLTTTNDRMGRFIAHYETYKIIKKICNPILINFSRGGVVNTTDVLTALNENLLSSFVCDFPEPALIKHQKVIALPHLGASTMEAEQNCAVMVANNLIDYIENGNINYSVNFPTAVMNRVNGYRLTVANKNIPNMVGQISTYIANAGLNIEDLLNKSFGDLAYTIVDLDAAIPAKIIDQISNIEGVLLVRNLGSS